MLDDGEALIESAAILDHLDEVAGPAAALIAEHGPDRRRALKVCALATGLADKAVSLLYEGTVLRKAPARNAVWAERCTRANHRDSPRCSKRGALYKRSSPFLLGDGPQPCRHRRRLCAALRWRGPCRACSIVERYPL